MIDYNTKMTKSQLIEELNKTNEILAHMTASILSTPKEVIQSETKGKTKKKEKSSEESISEDLDNLEIIFTNQEYHKREYAHSMDVKFDEIEYIKEKLMIARVILAPMPDANGKHPFDKDVEAAANEYVLKVLEKELIKMRDENDSTSN